MAVLGLHFCAMAFSSGGKRGPLLIVVCGPLIIAASPVAEHRLQTRRLSNCGPRTQSLRGMWDPPRPGLEPASPTLAGRLSTTAPPGKPMITFLCVNIFILFYCRKLYITYYLPFSPFLSVQFRSINYIHNIVQPSPLSISNFFHHPKQKVFTHQAITPIAPPPSL